LNYKILLIFITLLFLPCESNLNLDRRSENIHSKNLNLKFNISNNKSIKLLSWNIRDLGKSKDDQEILQIAKIINPFDLIAIQEVVAKDPAGAQAVAKIVAELNRMGSAWDYSISDPTNSPSVFMSERYAFIWKKSKLKLLEKPFLDEKLKDTIYREPYIGKFKLKKDLNNFYVINYHSRKYNDNPEEEIIFFDKYPKRLKSNNILIAGDFNLNEKHSVWNSLYELGFKSAIQDSPTTLKTKCKNGIYLNHSIDNIYFDNKNISTINSGRVDFVMHCDNLEQARFLSDHLPVFLEFNIKNN
jgi:deoxyribonuclease-1-like protein